MMMILLVFLQKQNLASAIYLFGLGTRLSGPGLKTLNRLEKAKSSLPVTPPPPSCLSSSSTAQSRRAISNCESCGRASTQQVLRGSAGRPAAPQTAQRVRHGGGFCIIGAFSRRRRRLHPRTSRRRNWSKCRVVTDVTRYYRDSVPEAN